MNAAYSKWAGFMSANNSESTSKLMRLGHESGVADGGASLDMDGLTIELEDDRYKDGIVGYTLKQYDLTQLQGIQLLYEFPDYEKRRQEAEKRTKGRRATSTILGAIAGGLIDSSVGDDDSVLDGVLLGGVAGYATTSVEQINLKEQSNHLVNLLFNDGAALCLNVGADDLALLLQALHKVKAKYAEEPIKASVREIPLSEKKAAGSKEAADAILANSTARIHLKIA